MMASAEAKANRAVRRKRRTIGRLLPVALLVTVSAVFGLLSPASAADLSMFPDAGAVQTDGTVRTILVKGNKIYIGGTFTTVDGEPRSRLAAIYATGASEGELVPNWRPRANGTVYALAASPGDGSRIYAGGDFTSVSGTDGPFAPRDHLVAIHAAGEPEGGNVIAGWQAEANGRVYSLETLNDRVYFGGQFDRVNGVPHTRLAAVDGVTGQLDENWTPDPTGNVRTLVASPDKSLIYAGGNFSRIDDKRRKNLAALDPLGTGAATSWVADREVENNYEVFDLEVTNDRVHVAGGGQDPDGTAESFDATKTKDNSVWRHWTSGDFQAVTLLDGKLYFGGHFIRFFEGPSNTTPVVARHNKLVAVDAGTGVLDEQWKPEADKGIWAMTEDLDRTRVYAGGAFTEINNEPRVGFAQFSVP